MGMGIYDRDYVRNDKRSVFDTFTSRTQVCITLIIINVVVFLVQLATYPRNPLNQLNWGRGDLGWFTESLILDVDKVLHGQIWRLLTSAFLHSPENWLHILFNMLFLWWMGAHVEDIYGGKEFLAFYLCAAFLAGLGYMGIQLLEGKSNSALGASGAVTAVMVLFATHYPNRIFYLFVIPVPVWAFVLFNILKDVFGLLGGTPEPIAYSAHLTGAAFGFLYAYFSWRVTNWLPRLPGRSKTSQRKIAPVRVFQPVPDEGEESTPKSTPSPVSASVSVTGKSTSEGSKVDEYLEAKLDEILEKVTKFGKESLNEEEREILLKASEIYRKKRQN
jgi:membrane associated rhomboid family serine protease